MKCPNCSAAAADDAAECASCGVIFAKWLERREKEKAEAQAAAALEAEPARSAADPRRIWYVRAGSIAVVVLWMASLALYYRHRLARRARASYGTPTGEFAEMRDPNTGEIRKLPIRRAPGVPMPAPAPAAPAAPEESPAPAGPPPMPRGVPVPQIRTRGDAADNP